MMNSKILVVIFLLISLSQSQEVKCQIDEDCDDRWYCNEENHDCERLPLFPMITKEIIGSVVIGTLIGFCQAAGIGGGVILTPTFSYFFSFSLKHCIALNFIVIFTGSLGNFLKKSRNRFPIGEENGVPLIDYDLALLTIPMLLSGAVCGVTINRWIPDSFVGVILIFTLVHQSLIKTWKTYRKQRQNEIEQADPQEQQKLLEVQGILKKQDITENPEQVLMKNRETRLAPWNKWGKMLSILAIVILFSVMKGGKGLQSIIGIPSCGWAYWAINILQIMVCVKFLGYISADVELNEKEKVRLNWEFDTYGARMESSQVKHIATGGFMAGFLGGILGLGGAVILNPIWFEIGIPPIRAQATASFTVLFTSFVSFFQVFCSGGYILDESLYFASIAFVSSIIIGQILGYIVRRLNRASILLLILTIIICASIVIMPLTIIKKLIKHPEQIFEFSSPC